MITLLTWDDIYTNALETGFLSRELKAKDNAREELKILIQQDKGVNIDDTECPEDTIDDWLKEQEEVPYFDSNGNLIARIKCYAGMDKSVKQVTDQFAALFPNNDLEGVFKELELPYDKSL